MTQAKVISVNRAMEILGTYGADPQRWPATERDGVLAWIERSPQVAALRRVETQLDTVLDDWPAPPSTAAARAAILSRVATSAPAVRLPSKWQVAFGGLAAAIALVAIGLTVVRLGSSSVTGVQLADVDAQSLVYSSTISLDDEDWSL